MQMQATFTAPYGRRALSLGMVAAQLSARDIEPDATIDKWKLFRSLCEGRVKLGLSDRALVVLNALLTFYPHNDLSPANGLVVFPSNTQLSLRAHGMAPATLRRHLSALVDAGVIFRKDSPNGKRFSRKCRNSGQSRLDSASGFTGEFTGEREAFGFNIAPLIARAQEFEVLAQEVREERYRFKMLKERISLTRRDVDKLIDLGAQTLPQLDWQAKYTLFRSVVDAIARNADLDDLSLALDGLECLQIEISNLLEMHQNKTNMSANESHNERHKQNSNTQSISDLEPGLEEKPRSNLDVKKAAGGANTNTAKNALRKQGAISGNPDIDEKAVPLGLVLKACPDIADYTKSGVASWRDLMTAAVVVRSTLGVSPSAYEDACVVFGQERAAVIIACILQRAGHINSAGGYLRSLTEKAKVDGFSIWPMLLAQLRVNGGHLAVVG